MYDAYIIVLISIVSACVSEGISWLLIYRTEEYKKLKKSIDQLTAKVDKKKLEKGDIVGSPDGKTLAKKLNTLDEQLKAKNREMSFTKMQSTICVGVILLGVFGLLNHLFEGQVVAKLPFEPFSLLRSMSHRGLSGSDYTDCSMIFIYILCQLSVRANIQKYLGFTPANAGPSLFQPPQQ